MLHGFGLLVLIGSCCSTLTVQALEQSQELTVNNTDTNKPEEEDIYVRPYTVVTDINFGQYMFLRSAASLEIKIIPLGINDVFSRGKVENPTGGYKMRLLRTAIEPFKEHTNSIILYSNSYDVTFIADVEEIYYRFKESGANVLFSADRFCWPDVSLADQYPPVYELGSARYLNAGAFIGYAPQVYAMLSGAPTDDDDAQLYFTKLFLQENLRYELGIRLDSQSLLFENVNTVKDDVKLSEQWLHRLGTLTGAHMVTESCIVLGNGPTKMLLNSTALRYNAEWFSFQKECLTLDVGLMMPPSGKSILTPQQQLQEDNLPVVTLAILITQAVPFFDMFLDRIEKINYPKNKMHLFIYSNEIFHDNMANSFFKRLGSEYLSAKIVLSPRKLNEKRGRTWALKLAKSKHSDYMLVVGALAHIDDPELLRELLTANKQFIGPVLSRFGVRLTNFWTDLNNANDDPNTICYEDIIERSVIGIWNVSLVIGVYLIKNTAFEHVKYDDKDYDYEIAMCNALREAGISLYVINVRVYGHLVNMDEFDTTVIRPDFYMFHSNKFDWVKKYMHTDYANFLEPNSTIDEPCPDVYRMPLLTDVFSDDLIAIAEHFWNEHDGPAANSSVQMKQIGLEKVWLTILDMFLLPMEMRVYSDQKLYESPSSSFIVRYGPHERSFAGSHATLASSYTHQIVLNQVGVDFHGGGCHFKRYSCTVHAKKGWMMVHPGPLTHYYERLPVSNGTSYMLVSIL